MQVKHGVYYWIKFIKSYTYFPLFSVSSMNFTIQGLTHYATIVNYKLITLQTLQRN